MKIKEILINGEIVIISEEDYDILTKTGTVVIDGITYELED